MQGGMQGVPLPCAQMHETWCRWGYPGLVWRHGGMWSSWWPPVQGLLLFLHASSHWMWPGSRGCYSSGGPVCAGAACSSSIPHGRIPALGQVCVLFPSLSVWWQAKAIDKEGGFRKWFVWLNWHLYIKCLKKVFGLSLRVALPLARSRVAPF